MSDKVYPIRPENVVFEKERSTPNEVFEAFNELIVQEWDGICANILQDTVVSVIIEKFNKAGFLNKDGEPINRKEIFERRWLEIEDIYRKAGWRVEHDELPVRFIFKKPAR